MEVLGRGEGRGETIGTRTLSQRPTLPDSKHGQQPAIRTMEDKGKKDGDELADSWMDIHSMI